VSSAVFRYLLIISLSWACWARAHAQAAPGSQSGASSAKSAPARPTDGDPQRLFEQGEAALKSGDLEQAEHAFRAVITLNPQLAGAYANLGVVCMRRKQWPQALQMLERAEHLAPQVPGIRLNLGLVHYRQNDFTKAIPPFESVLRDVPDSYQARYLLGLCYFFTERYADAVTTLDPLWAQASNQLNYLYVLGIAANKAERPEIEQRALGRLVETGGDSPEFHLLIGKAHLNRDEYDEALPEFELAAKSSPRLPFVHFYLGTVYLKKQD